MSMSFTIAAHRGGNTQMVAPARADDAATCTDLLPESTLRDVVDLAVRLVEFADALVIFAGAAWAFMQFVRHGADRLRSRGYPRPLPSVSSGSG
ncbi:hypothetical protein [Streptomyces sp. NPDC055400]